MNSPQVTMYVHTHAALPLTVAIPAITSINCLHSSETFFFIAICFQYEFHTNSKKYVFFFLTI